MFIIAVPPITEHRSRNVLTHTYRDAHYEEVLYKRSETLYGKDGLFILTAYGSQTRIEIEESVLYFSRQSGPAKSRAKPKLLYGSRRKRDMFIGLEYLTSHVRADVLPQPGDL